MYSEITTIVNVKQTGENEYQLDMTAGELYVRSGSGDVIRRHAVSAIENKYVALSAMKLDGGTYTFTFESGDAFTATSPDAYPTASSVSDNVGGGGGGGVLVVHETDTEPVVLDKTWKEIHDAMLSGGAVIVEVSGDIGNLQNVGNVDEHYYISASTDHSHYVADAESGYPQAEGME